MSKLGWTGNKLGVISSADRGDAKVSAPSTVGTQTKIKPLKSNETGTESPVPKPKCENSPQKLPIPEESSIPANLPSVEEIDDFNREIEQLEILTCAEKRKKHSVILDIDPEDSPSSAVQAPTRASFSLVQERRSKMRRHSPSVRPWLTNNSAVKSSAAPTLVDVENSFAVRIHRLPTPKAQTLSSSPTVTPATPVSSQNFQEVSCSSSTHFGKTSSSPSSNVALSLAPLPELPSLSSLLSSENAPCDNRVPSENNFEVLAKNLLPLPPQRKPIPIRSAPAVHIRDMALNGINFEPAASRNDIAQQLTDLAAQQVAKSNKDQHLLPKEPVDPLQQHYQVKWKSLEPTANEYSVDESEAKASPPSAPNSVPRTKFFTDLNQVENNAAVHGHDHKDEPSAKESNKKTKCCWPFSRCC